MTLRSRTIGLLLVLLAIWAVLGLLSWPPAPGRHREEQPAPLETQISTPTTTAETKDTPMEEARETLPPVIHKPRSTRTTTTLSTTPAPPRHHRGHQCEEGLMTALNRITHQRPPFSQVHSHNIGTVLPSTIDTTLGRLGRKFIPVGIGKTNVTIPNNVVLFAIDGTLLNLLRWGQIVNDNDIDLGFYINNVTHVSGGESELPVMRLMDHYITLYRVLGALGVVDPPTERNLKKLHHRYAPVKMGRCLHRRHGMMQCRDRRTGVYIDIFGPDALFRFVRGRTVLTRTMIEPLQACFVAGSVFPCPSNPVGVLTTFELDLSADGESTTTLVVGDEHSPPPSEESPRYNEFQGCALFPPSRKEHTHHHYNSIIASGRVLQGCGFPTLLKQMSHPACKEIMQRKEEEETTSLPPS